jgi:hypothetical protein
MENKYKYFKNKNNDKIYRIHLEHDEYPWNPRTEDDGNVGHMMVWWNRYSLGDTKENTYSDPESFVNDLVRKYVSEKSIINYVKAKKTSNGLELRYNRKDELWELWGYYWLFPLGNSKDAKFGVIESNNPIDYLVDDIIEAMSFKDKWKLLERNGIAYLPLYIYEHSGITISTGGFSCPWDSGQAGWIYTTKEEIMKYGGKILSDKGNYINVTDRNWKQAAYKWMQGEVDIYDQYLRGDCYGYILDELDMDSQASLESKMNFLDEDDMEWNENVDSCWGFFSDKWGDDLIEEIAKEAANFEKLCDDLKEVA